MLDGYAHPRLQRPQVQRARPEDEAPLFDLLLALEDDNGMGVPRSDQRVWEHINAVCRTNGGVGGIIREDDKIVASFGIVFSQIAWYSDEWCMREIWFFVRPEVRRIGRYAEALRDGMLAERAILSDAMKRPVKLLTGPNSFKRLDAKARWWSRWSRKVGVNFVVEG